MERGSGRVTGQAGERLLLVGVDVGTTLTKAGVVDSGGREIVRAAVPTVWRPTATGAETSGDALLASVLDVLREVMVVAPRGSVVALGVTSMAETVVLLDAAGGTLGPAIAWHDVRATGEHEAYRRDLGTDAIGRCTGLGTSQIPTIATLRWLARNVVETRRAVRALSVAEWIAYRIGGEQAAEASLASRTGALAVAGRAWWSDALEWASVPSTLFPPVRQAGTPFGRIHEAPPGCERLRGAVVTVAGHDHLCGSVGIGAVDSSQVTDSCGTAEALVRAVPASPDRDLSEGLDRGLEIGWHVLADHYAVIGGLSLGLNLTAVLGRLRVVSEHGSTSLDQGALALGSGNLSRRDAPRSPVASLRERVDVSEIERLGDGSPEATWRAALESAVAGARELLDGFEALGGPVAEVRISGGWSRNPVLVALKRSCFPAPTYPRVEEAGIRGAALLAGLAAGLFASVDELPPPPVGDASVARAAAASGGFE